MQNVIDCHKCEYYYVTWDKHFPHGCKAMKFKSKQLPSVVVLTSSQTDCLLFQEKTPRGGKEPHRVSRKATSSHEGDTDSGGGERTLGPEPIQ